MSVDLKPCPFCGKDSLGRNDPWEEEDADGYFWVTCLSCVADGPPASSKSHAIKLWNERKASDDA